MRSWLRHPSVLFFVIFLMMFFVLTLGLSLPCGRGGVPIHGICSNGAPLMTPQSLLVLGLLIGVFVSLLAMIIGPHDGKWSTVRVVQDFVSERRLRGKRPFTYVLFLMTYIFLALITYFFFNQNAGLRWYNYVAQYVVVLPIFASYISHLFTKKYAKSSKK